MICKESMGFPRSFRSVDRSACSSKYLSMILKEVNIDFILTTWLRSIKNCPSLFYGSEKVFCKKNYFVPKPVLILCDPGIYKLVEFRRPVTSSSYFIEPKYCVLFIQHLKIKHLKKFIMIIINLLLFSISQAYLPKKNKY